MPLTFRVIMFIMESDMFGSMGAVATIGTVPTNPEQWAIPLASRLTPAGCGCAEPKGMRDHSTGGDITDMGFMLYIPVAVNCTPPEVLDAVAMAGVTVMLCNCRDVSIMPPPQLAMPATVTQANIRANRIFERVNDLVMSYLLPAAVGEQLFIG